MELVYYHLNLKERLNKEHTFNLSPKIEININFDDNIPNTISKIDISWKNETNIFNSYNNRILNLNVLIGKNGTGKTTLLNKLQDIIWKLSQLKADEENETNIGNMFNYKYAIIFMDKNELHLYTNYKNAKRSVKEFNEKDGMKKLDVNKIDKLVNILIVSYSNIIDYSRYDITQYRNGNNCLTISDLSLMEKEWKDFKENTENELYKYSMSPLTIFYHNETYRQIRYYEDNKDKIPFKINGIFVKNKVMPDNDSEIRKKINKIVNYNFSDEQNNHGKVKYILHLLMYVLLETYTLQANLVSKKREIQGKRERFFQKIDLKSNKFTNCMQLVDYLLKQMFLHSGLNCKPVYGDKSDFKELVQFIYTNIDDSQFTQDGNVMYLRKYDFEANGKTVSNVDHVMKYYDKITNRQLSYLDFEWKMSNGEQKLLSMLSRFYSIKDTINSEKKKTFLFLLDEPDTSLHPVWQQEFIMNVMKYISKLFSSKLQFIITTHSPIFLSDIPKYQICYLDNNIEHEEETFASNIFSLYKKSFILKSTNLGVIGDFSNELIKNISYILDSWILYLEVLNSYKLETGDDESKQILKEEVKIKKRKLKYILRNKISDDVIVKRQKMLKEIMQFINNEKIDDESMETKMKEKIIKVEYKCLNHCKNITQLIGDPIIKQALNRKIQTIEEYIEDK